MTAKYDRAIYWWLISGALLVALMVVIGGITRLTHSGLSMVEWKPIVGAIPPLNEQEWLVEFDKYKQSPEFKLVHSHFTLSEFKSIFFWEYLHRLIGRIIGLVFVIPFIIFWVKKRFSKELKRKVMIIFLLGLLQGVIGWYMVKSGLVKNPHVSHYRLATHLVTALILIAFIYYTALGVKYGFRKTVSNIKLNRYLTIFLVLLLFQIIYGAFVAGLKAGFMYNNFPKMGISWFPSELGHEFRNRGLISLMESGGTVQLIHRILAFIVLFTAIFIYVKFIRISTSFTVKRGLNILLFSVSAQVLLGIITLILIVPVFLGVFHQAMAIILISITLNIRFHNRV